jgi:MinD superfamily P-loop ATPase
LAWEAFSPLGKPMGAVINRAGVGDDSVYRFCRAKGIPIMAEIAYDRAIAEAYSRGDVVTSVSAAVRQTFGSLALKIQVMGAAGDADRWEAAHG